MSCKHVPKLFALISHDVNTCLHSRPPLQEAAGVAAVGTEAAAATGSGSSSNRNSNEITQSVAWVRTRGESSKQNAQREKGSGLGNLLSSWGQASKEPIARLKARHGRHLAHEDVNRKVQAAAKAAGVRPEYKLTFWGCMVAGAVSRR